MSAPVQLPSCGTDAAYYRHRRRRRQPCPACCAAHAAAERARYQRRTRTLVSA